MAEILSRAWTADEAAEYRRSRGPDQTGEAVPMDRTAAVSSGEDHRPGVESDSVGDDGRGDDPTPQEG
ncbi:hypothetical protein [Streptomyces griseocarneus]|uniref:hypothetical protein n=1 Tax=Streptomyces griseocarneus TaxID=51201 RepID=UPI00167E9329|nr:hypothetical protein [Streptomyces griseocarneus]GHG84375.1 hypothetical protein GCM10018779_67760 [Streptomyces griseocarneus]